MPGNRKVVLLLELKVAACAEGVFWKQTWDTTGDPCHAHQGTARKARASATGFKIITLWAATDLQPLICRLWFLRLDRLGRAARPFFCQFLFDFSFDFLLWLCSALLACQGPSASLCGPLFLICELHVQSQDKTLCLHTRFRLDVSNFILLVIRFMAKYYDFRSISDPVLLTGTTAEPFFDADFGELFWIRVKLKVLKHGRSRKRACHYVEAEGVSRRALEDGQMRDLSLVYDMPTPPNKSA